MQPHQEVAMSTAQHHPKVSDKFVHGVYSILKGAVLEKYLHHISNLHQNIYFTMEEESNEKLVLFET